MTASPDPSAKSRPTNLDLKLREQVLEIVWGDGERSAFRAPFLRKNCPCAECRTERAKQATTLLPILSLGAMNEVPRVTGGGTVGNYAIQLEWSDGHNTGIYDFKRLREWHDQGQ